MPIRVIVTDADGNSRCRARRASRAAEDDVHVGDAGSRGRRKRAAGDQIRYRRDGRRHLRRRRRSPRSSRRPMPARIASLRTLAARDAARARRARRESKSSRSAPARPIGGCNDPNAVAVKLDKKQYAVGDTATALIASPFADADVYVAVVRSDTIYRTTLHGVRGAVARARSRSRRRCCPTPRSRRWSCAAASRSRRSTGALDALARTGMAAFNVDVAGRYLKLAIAPQSATVTPGGAQRVAFRADGEGRLAGAW